MNNSRHLYYLIWGIFTVFIIAIIVIYLSIINIDFEFPVLERLDDFQKNSITLVIERVKLLSGLATLLISASFIMLGVLFSIRANVRSIGALFILAAISIWGISIICGYYTYEIMIDMIFHKTYEISSKLVVAPSLLQFILLILGFPFLLHGIFKILISKGGKLA